MPSWFRLCVVAVVAAFPRGAASQDPSAPLDKFAVITRVKSDTLAVDGKRSAVSIGSAVAYNGYTNRFTMHVWSAVETTPGNWTVTVKGQALKGQPDNAQWSYNAAASEVKALDPYAEALSHRSIPALECLAAAEANGSVAVKPAQVTRIIILPLPAPLHAKPYSLRAEFLVGYTGLGTLLEWNEPNDPAWAKRVFDTLRGYTFRAALSAKGEATCARTVIRASVGR